MTQHYPHVFQPIRIGPIDVRNRFYFAPHTIALTADSAPSDDAVEYYGARAEGGVGLIIQSLSVDSRQIGRISPFAESRVKSFAVLADRVHGHGAKIFGQLHHSWVNRLYQWEPSGPAAPSLSSSVNQRFEHYSVSREMSTKDIKAWLEDFRQCVHHLRQAGFDGIEVHATHGVLLSHFLSPYFNQRKDEYGGSVENRLRMVIEALEIAREEADGTMAVGIRYNCDEMVPNGMTSKDASEALAILVEKKLLDYVDLDIAIEPNQFVLGMPSCFLDKLPYEGFVRELRAAAGSVPVLGCLGRLTDMADAERVIAEGTVDLVGAARGLIAEPDLVKNAQEGHDERSRQCIACNFCFLGDGFNCSINPATGRERRWGVNTYARVAHPGRVVVVGGGPGGMEAAITAARKGHQVTLFERRQDVGGALNLWAKIPGREVIKTTRDWYARELSRHGVDVRTGIEATSESVLAERPDALIVATGSVYDREGKSGFMPAPIPGWDQNFIYTPEQILEGGLRPKGRVVILDDESKSTGPGIAEILAADGAEVELMTRWLQPVYHLMDTLEFAFVIPRLKALDIKLSTQEYIKEIGDHCLTIFDVFVNSERVIEDVDAVILSNMRLPVNALALDLEDRVDQVFAVGDALAPRSLPEATHEGQRFARMLGEPGAPTNFTEAWREPIPAEAFARPASVR